MSFENLPGIFPNKIDGNLLITATNENPIVIVLGTSPRGTNDVYTVGSVSEAAQEFGRNDGTLVRGMYEAVAGGAANLKLYRIGATFATLELIGGGITMSTVSQDAEAGDAYNIFWEDSTGRLRVWRDSDDLLIYDNNPAYPTAAIDENEVSVSGAQVGTPGDIGTLAVPISMAASDGVNGASYTDGSDGILLSRMALFEELFKAYKLLENEDIDVALPMNAYLDDANVKDMTTTEVATLNTLPPWSAASVYPIPGTAFDALGEVFVQEYEGSWYFWWDLDRDGIAEIYPTVGSASATEDAFAVALTPSDFHEANFGYQLANWCYTQSEDSEEMIGMVGVLPPNSWSLADVAAWVGRTPDYDEDSGGNLIVDSNGSGLRGNKWMAGHRGNGGTGVPSFIINSISGLAYGGFIATDDGWPDGTHQEDRNDHLIDIGKYISVVGAQAVTSNPTNPTSYAASGAALYGGFVSSLPGNSAPTNKVQPGARLPFRINNAKLDALAGLRYVMFQAKTKGNVVADAPSAARPDSDYQRLTTIRIVKATIDSIRNVAEPFLGEGITGARLAALETAIDQALVKLQKGEYLQRYDVAVSSTPTQQVLGQAVVELVLVPAFELRQITVNVALAAQ